LKTQMPKVANNQALMEKELLTLAFAFRPLSDDPEGERENDLAAADELEDLDEDEGEELDGDTDKGVNDPDEEENL